MATNAGFLCPVCRCDNTRVLWDDIVILAGEPRKGRQEFAFGFLSCACCEHHFVAPTPELGTIYQFYDEGYYTRKNAKTALEGHLYSRSKAWVAKHRFATSSGIPGSISSGILRLATGAVELLSGRIISFSLSVPLTLPNTAKMLDIGCGDGSWLVFMQSKGYANLEGNDILNECISTVGELGIPFHWGDLPEINLTAESYDLIRLEHVLEHIGEPVTYLTEVARLLTETGTLVLTIPTIDSPCFKKLGKSWRALELPIHLNMFSLKSLLIILDRAGLTVKRYRYLPVWTLCLGSLSDAESSSRRMGKAIRTLLANRALSVIIAPAYALIMRLWGKGDFVSIECEKRKRVLPDV